MQYVNHLSDKQLAVLSTFFTLGFVGLTLLNFNLYPHFKKQERGVEIRLESPQIAPEKETPPTPTKKAVTTQGFQSNQSYNTQQKATYAPNKAQEPVPNNNPSQTSAAESFEEKLSALAKEKQRIIDSMKAIKGTITNTPSRTRVYYSLFEREKTSLPIPVYTCKQGGKVVVNIKVNAQGQVVGAEINTALSQTTNGCLLENALAYAQKANFKTSKRKIQWGTITYIFKSKP